MDIQAILTKDEHVIKQFSISDHYIYFHMLFNVVETIIMIIGVILIQFFFPFTLPLLGLITLPVILGLVVLGALSVLYYAKYLKQANQYFITNKRLIIVKGWLARNTISINYSKITDMVVRQNLIEQTFSKTGSLAINTAGGTNLEVQLLHIDNPHQIRTQISELSETKPAVEN